MADDQHETAPLGPFSPVEASPGHTLLASEPGTLSTSSSPSSAASAVPSSSSSLSFSSRCVEFAPEVRQDSVASSADEQLGPGHAHAAPERQDSRYKAFPRRQDSKYFLDSVPHPQMSMKAIGTAHGREPVERGDEPRGDSGPERRASLATGSEINRRASGSEDPAGAAATATQKGSVMTAELGGFYRKLLGEDWREQIAEMNEETLLDPFDEADDEDISAGAGPAAAPAAAPGDDLNLPDKHHGKVRQRIRRRDVTASKDISDQVADDLHLGEDEEPLITPDDIAEIRATAWIPAGEGLPVLSEMELGYHRAWDVGKKGCLAVKVDGIWDSAVKGNKMRFFVMDGTDTESFLTFYSKSDLQAARGLQSEKLGIITAWDMRDGYWNYPKKKIFIQRSDRKNRECILEGFTAEFYDAMLLCIWEMCVQASIEQLKHQRRRERNKRRQSLCGSMPNSRVSGRGGETRHMSAALVTFKDVPRYRGKRSESQALEPNRSVAEMREAAAVHRQVMKQLCAEWRSVLHRRGQADVETWLRRRRKGRSAGGREDAGDSRRREQDGQAEIRQRSMRRMASRGGSTPHERKGNAAASWSRSGTHADVETGGVTPSPSDATPLRDSRRSTSRTGVPREPNGENREADSHSGEDWTEEDAHSWERGDASSDNLAQGLARDRSRASGSRLFGGLPRQPVRSAQLEAERPGVNSGGEFEVDSPSSEWRRAGAEQLPALSLEGLSPFSSGPGPRMSFSGRELGRRKSLASKRGLGNGLSGSSTKLSKYESLNRVPPARPQGSETPLLTPGEMTPRDPEDERPKFG
ncbi:conserved hypothetical protein [Neospora caninum Liverpool]|uniref:Uncharacterized protein n=1 Tax=Neospora caninum (strain Liverpool) TaxID=572307 RepID=F0VMI9_NEOCL|nr:conserved hypothetical protein [Neospora caninum Liverpool]CBZ54935.1 conserved hypothetical protein [Neospora caninum Liverpool]CEL69657.1 TPA: hypothetical protein BN1204_053620 [Neospora caninum Liverpool]|eukprot:XP_003884963.1 conserved hypothetical protein [Neospora caninum Liverpool]